jgi:hypothetical protein
MVRRGRVGELIEAGGKVRGSAQDVPVAQGSGKVRRGKPLLYSKSFSGLGTFFFGASINLNLMTRAIFHDIVFEVRKPSLPQFCFDPFFSFYRRVLGIEPAKFSAHAFAFFESSTIKALTAVIDDTIGEQASSRNCAAPLEGLTRINSTVPPGRSNIEPAPTLKRWAIFGGPSGTPRARHGEVISIPAPARKLPKII